MLSEQQLHLEQCRNLFLEMLDDSSRLAIRMLFSSEKNILESLVDHLSDISAQELSSVSIRVSIIGTQLKLSNQEKKSLLLIYLKSR